MSQVFICLLPLLHLPQRAGLPAPAPVLLCPKRHLQWLLVHKRKLTLLLKIQPWSVNASFLEALHCCIDTYSGIQSPKLGSQSGLNGEARSPPPRSFNSPAPSTHSRGTQKSRATEKQSTTYPPLPPSQTHSNIGSGFTGKYQRPYSRAPSLSPSDSPSQMKAQRNARSVGKEPSLPPVPPSDGDSQAGGDPKPIYSQMSGEGEFFFSTSGHFSAYVMSEVRSRAAGPSILSNGNRQRPFSPYRNGPTEQDLLHAAIHGLNLKLDAIAPSNGSPSKHSRSATPRALSPGLDELNEEEARLVEDVLNQGSKTPRTSYAATSVLEPNQFAHYHDMNLCILLHQLDDPNQHEVVKKAVRKAVKSRVKQLGMKYDNEVSLCSMGRHVATMMADIT